MRLFSRNFYLWIRDLHLYVGLFISPFIILFAVTTLMFNHTWKPWNNREGLVKVEMPVQVPEDVEGVEQAKAVMKQVGVSGEIRNIFRRRNRLTIPVMRPGYNASIQVNLETGIAVVEEGETDFWDALMYLHKSPGPHVANIRGNWIFTRIWTFLVDGVVYLILFISVSGIYLWIVLKAERKIGLVVLGTGCLTFAAIVTALVL
ncbi:MAG: hypothetical protein ACI8V2_001097 [Candidatus Latescibacterota bacterium]|jgi:hypothetical protein